MDKKKRYSDYNTYLRQLFGQRVQKIAIDAASKFIESFIDVGKWNNMLDRENGIKQELMNAA